MSRPPPGRAPSGSKASTIRPWSAGCPWPISCRATAVDRRSGRSTRWAADSRPTATAGSTRRASPAGSPNRWPGVSASWAPPTPCSRSRPAPATTSTSPGTGSTAATVATGRRLRLLDLRRGCLGQHAGHEVRDAHHRHHPGRAHGSRARRERRTLVRAQRRRLARQCGMERDDGRGRLHRVARARRRRHRGPPNDDLQGRRSGHGHLGRQGRRRAGRGRRRVRGAHPPPRRHRDPGCLRRPNRSGRDRPRVRDDLEDPLLPTGQRPLRQDDDPRRSGSPTRRP